MPPSTLVAYVYSSWCYPQVPLFQDCEEGFVSALTTRIRMISLGPGEIIFRVGDVGREMYIIKKVSGQCFARDACGA